MVITGRLVSIVIMVLSFGIGFITLYVLGVLSKEQRRRYLDEIMSQIINLVLFVWAGKVILNFPIFMEDPLSALAYPSGSEAFYLAVVCTAVLFFYKSSKWRLDTLLFVKSLLLVLLTASFTYEFVQYIWNDNHSVLLYMILLMVLLLVFILMHNRLSSGTLILFILAVWFIGVLSLLFIQPFVTVFGYIIRPWFLVILFVIVFSYILYFKRKRK